MFKNTASLRSDFCSPSFGQLFGFLRNHCSPSPEYADKEGVSRTAESLGDYEKALKYVVKPERKVNLLIRMENFIEARDFSAGLESPIKYLDLIRESAKKLLEVKIKSQDFIGAMELTDVAEYEASEREDILLLGRKSIERKIASAKSEEDIRSVYRDRVKLEEKAGHFEEAGRIAEKVLKDLNLASLLYEKANLYNYAIHAASEHFEKKKDKNEAKIRLAELHEKGGNILSAANLYESAGIYDKAYQLYEITEQFNKAIECYLKLPDHNQNVLMQLYNVAGEFDKIVEIYLKSETYPDLEKALSIAKTHSLDYYIPIIQDKIGNLLSGGKDDLMRCFSKAKDEILNSYNDIFGIDFGTTNSVAAIFNKHKKTVEIIPSSRGINFEPSFFGVDENERLIYGEEAQSRHLIAPDSAVASVKRSLGDKGKIFQVGKKQYRGEEVVANILQRIKGNAELYLKSKVEDKFYKHLKNNNYLFPKEMIEKFIDNQTDYIHLKNVVLSVPAFFNDNQKRATKDSAEI